MSLDLLFIRCRFMRSLLSGEIPENKTGTSKVGAIAKAQGAQSFQLCERRIFVFEPPPPPLYKAI